MSLRAEMERERDAFERRLKYLREELSKAATIGITWPNFHAPAPATAAADTGPLPQKTRLEEAEDAVSQFINGGKCLITEHQGANTLAKLIMLKMLRMELPHLSMQMSSIEDAIRKELKEKK